MKCPLCNRRKAKRYCPAKKTSICPQCCGEKRVVEIPCPADCQYLTSGRSYQAGKEVVQQLSRLDDSRLQEKILAMKLRFPALIHFLESVIVEFNQELASLRDRDVADAVSLVLERYRLEQKGLIFQERSTKPFVDSLANELAKAIEEKRDSPKLEKGTRLPLEIFVTALEVVQADIDYQASKDAGPTQYLRHTRRNHPEIESQAKSGSLILPG